MNYKLFGNTGLRVSELCLGTMGFGTEWGWGADKETSKQIFDTFAKAGGNFIDTANIYTNGTSEKFIGEFMSSDRDHFIVSTKFSLKDKNDPNFSGNHRKNMMRSVKESLKRLNTDHIDILWLHAWDALTPTEEIMRGLDDLISRGIVHYIGISDTPAWVVSQANTMAQLRGWSQFAGLQVEYNLLQRTVEPELFQMAKAYGMTITPWAPLAGGALTGKYLKGETGRITEKSTRRDEKSVLMTQKLMEIADKMGVKASQLAVNWTRQHKGQSIVPIIGATKVHQMEEILGSIKFEIPIEFMYQLNELSKIELPFPQKFFTENTVVDVLYGASRDLILDKRY
jgi:aryl-alcohol dehydrogenase-like predicted oxidoreductase